MAKKFGKFLLYTTAVVGAAAAVYTYLQHKDAVSVTKEADDEDYDDFSEDEADAPVRSYVPLTKDTVDTEAEADTEDAELAETAAEVPTADIAEAENAAAEAAVEADAEAACESTEEFFDEEDPIEA